MLKLSVRLERYTLILSCSFPLQRHSSCSSWAVTHYRAMLLHFLKPEVRLHNSWEIHIRSYKHRPVTITKTSRLLVREMVCFRAFAAFVNRLIVAWVITGCRVVILFDVSEERAAAIFRVTELVSDGRWNARGKVVGMWPIRATKREVR
jgi:hypothetical protein